MNLFSTDGLNVCICEALRGEVMIAGFDFLSLTNFWGGFLKESVTPAFC